MCGWDISGCIVCVLAFKYVLLLQSCGCSYECESTVVFSGVAGVRDVVLFVDFIVADSLSAC